MQAEVQEVHQPKEFRELPRSPRSLLAADGARSLLALFAVAARGWFALLCVGVGVAGSTPLRAPIKDLATRIC